MPPMPLPRLTIYLLAFCALCFPVSAQEASKPATNAADFDLPAFVKETQLAVNEPGYVGVVWWFPTRYWELASERAGMSEEKAKERYSPLQRYTVIAVVVGKIGI